MQVVGALLVLAPFAAHQFGKLNTDALGYRANLLGSTALALLAALSGQWGFLLVEAA